MPEHKTVQATSGGGILTSLTLPVCQEASLEGPESHVSAESEASSENVPLPFSCLLGIGSTINARDEI